VGSDIDMLFDESFPVLLVIGRKAAFWISHVDNVCPLYRLPESEARARRRTLVSPAHVSSRARKSCPKLNGAPSSILRVRTNVKLT
jgi:hypothetical protein